MRKLFAIYMLLLNGYWLHHCHCLRVYAFVAELNMKLIMKNLIKVFCAFVFLFFISTPVTLAEEGDDDCKRIKITTNPDPARIVPGEKVDVTFSIDTASAGIVAIDGQGFHGGGGSSGFYGATVSLVPDGTTQYTKEVLFSDGLLDSCTVQIVVYSPGEPKPAPHFNVDTDSEWSRSPFSPVYSFGLSGQPSFQSDTHGRVIEVIMRVGPRTERPRPQWPQFILYDSPGEKGNVVDYVYGDAGIVTQKYIFSNTGDYPAGGVSSSEYGLLKTGVKYWFDGFAFIGEEEIEDFLEPGVIEDYFANGGTIEDFGYNTDNYNHFTHFIDRGIIQSEGGLCGGEDCLQEPQDDSSLGSNNDYFNNVVNYITAEIYEPEIEVPSVLLRWTPPVDQVDISQYEVYRAREENGVLQPFQFLGSAPATINEMVDSASLSFDATYAYRVMTKYGSKLPAPPEMNATAVVTTPSAPDAKVVDTPAIAALEDWTVSPSGTFPPNVSLLYGVASYDANTLDHFEIYRDGVLAGTGAAGTIFRDLSVQPGVTYTYTVVSVDQSGVKSDPSAPKAITTAGTAPVGQLLPPNPVLNATPYIQARASEKLPADKQFNIYDYSIINCVDNQEGLIKNRIITESLVPKFPTVGDTYIVRLRCTDSDGNAATPREINVLITEPTVSGETNEDMSVDPKAVSTVTAEITNTVDPEITVSWESPTDVTGEVVSYSVYRMDVVNGAYAEPVLVAEVPPDQLAFVDSNGVVLGKSFGYQIIPNYKDGTVVAMENNPIAPISVINNFGTLGDITKSTAVVGGGLVPCGDPGEPSCQFCHLVKMFELVLQWLVTVLTVLASLFFVYAGMRLVTSTGDAQAKLAAKKLIINTAVGFMIVLAAWLIVDFVLQALVGAPFAPVWHTISCVVQPNPSSP